MSEPSFVGQSRRLLARVGLHPHALRLDSLCSLTAAAGAMERAEEAEEPDV